MRRRRPASLDRGLARFLRGLEEAVRAEIPVYAPQAASPQNGSLPVPEGRQRLN